MAKQFIAQKHATNFDIVFSKHNDIHFNRADLSNQLNLLSSPTQYINRHKPEYQSQQWPH